jgi:hypothetical protein
MNKRVKELAEQASILSRQEHPKLAEAVTLNDILGRTDRRVYVVDDATTQKFAELIVRECLEACSRANEIRHFVPPTQQQVVLSCMNEIERHFGIEE